MHFKNIKFLYEVNCLIIVTFVLDVNSQNRGFCKTTSQENGLCVPILTCESVIKVLQMSAVPVPSSVAESVKKLHCGTYANIHHVCCKQDNLTNGSSISKSISPTDLSEKPGMAILKATRCGKTIQDKIVIGNGENALLAQYPWMVLLVYTKGLEKTLDCGGSLITDRYVLTAAHCINVRNKKLVSVRLGEHDLSQDIDCEDIFIHGEKVCSPPVQEIDIEEAIYHQDFSVRQFSNDIGLIRLSRKVVFSDSVLPVCLPITAGLQAMTLDRITIAGWGRVENGLRANILQVANIPIKNNEYCQEIHKLIRINDQQICGGGERNIDTCKGDSGGPIFRCANPRQDDMCVQYGIVSAGASRCGERFPGIYVKVTSYLPWIVENIRP